MARRPIEAVQDSTDDAPYGYKADGTPRQRAPVNRDNRKKTKGFLLYRIVDGELDIVDITRNSDVALTVISEDSTIKFKKIEV